VPEASSEVSFIEIGPKREVIAASPDVLASVPRPPRPAPPAATPGLQGPHIQFRSLQPLARPSQATLRPTLAPELTAFHAPESPEAARYLELFTAVRDSAAARAVLDHLILMFSGLRTGAGTTTLALNLAISAARQAKRVLVVDANLRRPGAAAKLGLDRAPGLSEVLAADCSLEAALRPTAQDRLMVLTSGEPLSVLADARTVQDLFCTLREQFDLVFVDGPIWDGKSTVNAFASASDAVYLVFPTAEADSPEATTLVRELPRQGARLRGTILTAF
jgi:Mrp family chromosome partitioning ATPase